MSLHHSTFAYLQPTSMQVRRMTNLRDAAATYAAILDAAIPEGPDKTYILRRVRETAMWVNVALIRHADGTPRYDVDNEKERV